MNDGIQKAAGMLRSAGKVVVLTGAGVSAESNVPTFRGKDGLWKQYRAEKLAAPEAFARNPQLVWEWYGWRQQLILKCSPNPAHKAIAAMEKRFPGFILITQNVDNLHRQAGSVNVLELHGNIFKARCPREGTVFDFTLGEEPLPLCSSCGTLIRPHIVWFGESLDGEVISSAFQHAADCDLLLTIGTSALVQPAASLPLAALREGAEVIEINLDPTPLTPFVTLSIQGKAGEITPKILEVAAND